MKTIKLLSLAALALVGCGDNKGGPDARIKDGKMIDGGPPPAPVIGAQIDRMGRPAINTALNHGFDGNATNAQMAKQDYNQTSDKAMWLTQAQVGEFAKNLALMDVLDSGVCGNGICEANETFATCPTPAGDCSATATPAGNGCGNQALYNGGVSGQPPTLMSYVALASILADDELYLDSGKTVCTFYLGVEFGVVTGGGNSTCGGRGPTYDVMDFSLSVIAMGLRGFSADGLFTPRVQDMVAAHADLSATDFPFLGAPH